MTKYEAIIFDLDGTAMPSAQEGMPNRAMCTAVRNNRSALKLCAATGRPWPLAKPIIQALGVTSPSIVAGGAVILDPLQEKILWQVEIDPLTVQSLIATVSDYPYKVACASNLDVTSPVEPAQLNFPGSLNTIYIADIEDDATAEAVARRLRQIKGITVSKAHSWNVSGGIDLHITSSQSTKEHAVNELCRMLDVDPAKVAGVGDGHNDIHLFNAVGHKIAMGNAVPELKSAADLVIASLDEDGLAKFIIGSA